MGEVTECTAADRDDFWQDTPQDATGATETGEQGGTPVRLPVIRCAHLGPHDTTGKHLRTMAERLGTNKLMGSNATAAARAVLLAYADEIDRIEPQRVGFPEQFANAPSMDQSERELRAYLAADKNEQEDK